MTDILDSVIGDLKRERIHTAIKKYSKFIVLLMTLLLIVALLFNWWVSHRNNVIHAEAAEYVKAQHFLHRVTNQQMLQEGLGRLEALSKGDTIYATIAAINLANIHDAMGNFNKAAHIYGEIENNRQIEQSLRAFAGLMKVASYLRAEKVTNDEALKMLQDRRRILYFQYSKQLLEASLLIQENKKQEARALLDNVKASIPKEQRNNIPELLAILTVN